MYLINQTEAATEHRVQVNRDHRVLDFRTLFYSRLM